jgi:hypothetical protein
MKKIHKQLFVVALSGVFCLFLSFSASAQHSRPSGGGGSSGGGSSSSSGGGGGGGGFSGGHTYSAPAPAPSRPSYSQNNYSRPSSSSPTGTRNVTQQRTYGTTRPSALGGRAVVAQGSYAGHYNAGGNTGVAQNYNDYQGSIYSRNHPLSPQSYDRGGFDYYPNRGYYHYNQGYYGSYYSPQLGFSIGFLPYGYYPFYFNDYQYFYSGGLFYQYDNDQYTVVEPPVGAEVLNLPSNAQSIVINGQQYYEVNGVYYQPITKDDGTLSYQVAGKDGELNTVVDNAPPALQMGDIVSQLPPGCSKININGDRLYVSPNGIYFKALLDQSNNRVYKIVGLPADQDQNQGEN